VTRAQYAAWLATNPTLPQRADVDRGLETHSGEDIRRSQLVLRASAQDGTIDGYHLQPVSCFDEAELRGALEDVYRDPLG
jgi:hypothetical protein